MISIRDFQHPNLSIPSWDIKTGQSWCVIGPNGAGKQFIDRVLMGKLPGKTPGAVQFSVALDAIQLVSFEEQQAVFEKEMKKAATDLLPDSETATQALEFLPEGSVDDPLLDILNLRHRLHSNYTQLSTGDPASAIPPTVIKTFIRVIFGFVSSKNSNSPPLRGGSRSVSCCVSRASKLIRSQTEEVHLALRGSTFADALTSCTLSSTRRTA